MTQTARVIKGGEDAVIEISRKSACEMCHETGSACTACNIFTSSKKASARAQNAIGANVGDIVEVESKETTILGFAAIVFLLPIAIPLILYLIFQTNMTIAVTVAVAAFLITSIAVYFVSKRYEKKKPVLKITKILKSTVENE